MVLQNILCMEIIIILTTTIIIIIIIMSTITTTTITTTPTTITPIHGDMINMESLWGKNIGGNFGNGITITIRMECPMPTTKINRHKDNGIMTNNNNNNNQQYGGRQFKLYREPWWCKFYHEIHHTGTSYLCV